MMKKFLKPLLGPLSAAEIALTIVLAAAIIYLSIKNKQLEDESIATTEYAYPGIRK